MEIDKMDSFLESIYRKSHIFYHGDTMGVEKLIIGNEKFKGQGLYLTDTPEYAVIYTKVSRKGKYDKDRTGTVYTIKLKNDTNIFNAQDPHDLKKLVDYVNDNFCPLTEDDINDLQTEDWYFFMKRKPEDMIDSEDIHWTKEDVIQWVKDLGFDGFFNNEDWILYIKENKKTVRYHSKGTGIMVFNTDILEIVNETDTKSFMEEHNISISDVLKLKELS